ncbi:hypothetical protein GTO89_14830 [Heliobacterium gestii]|uniref:Gp5/Type VI secretion system Vgr protein OB-fold domain-containing protein n=1 Tax=Heliomicrobium gestii TaxID=2699 RepID=A0A845LBX0_HELGE|nr:phage baseplate assembly protein V [Heliomicrobium gestii]MBM7868041.1 uncharacterized protein involved in type VI secretion and phage assembly [Heliomicrobium gestii]MZP44307.1 hypothetical protein [Heliomicrobium gestii]
MTYPGDPLDIVGEEVNGVMLGIVADNKDPEGLGRVKVTFPMLDDKNKSDWIRVTTLMAGGDRGVLFIPEVGDEVLIAFHLGVFRQPYVIGMLWNKDKKPPEGAKDEKNNIRKIHSRAGHEIVFDDGEKGEIAITTAKGNKIVLSDQSGTITVENGDGKKITIAKEGITVTSGQSSLDMKSSGQIEMKGQTIKISAQQMEIKATSLDVKADAQWNGESSGMLTLKGSMVKIN